MIAHRWALLAALLASTCTAAESSEVLQPPQRPKIGVALAGGSALGLAHVGVLRWLEEHRIPVDSIAGTSMGGLVGGLYATGHSVAEIEEFIRGIDWDFALAPGPSFRMLTYRRKEDFREYPSRFEFGYKKGLRIPAGLSAGHGVGLVLSRFTAPYGDLKSFDDLPTPFRCVATDLVTTREVVFDRGPLYNAMRATMSLPALFTPVEINNMVLVDGGLVNNLPVDVVRNMGADIVIAVTLEPPRDPKGDYSSSLLKVAGRSLSIMVTTNERRSLAQADLVIGPNLDGLSATDFTKAPPFYERGYAAAESRRLMLEKLALPEADYQRYLESRAARRRTELVKPQVVEIIARLDPERVAGLTRALTSTPDEPVDRDLLETSLTRLTGLGRYEAASYEFIRRPNQEGLLIQLTEKSHGPPFFRVAFTLDGNSSESLRFGIGGRLTFLDLGGPLSEWRTDLSIGTLNLLTTEYYYRIRASRFFIAPRASYEQQELPLYVQSRQVSAYTLRRAGGGIDFGYNFGRFKEVRAGFRAHFLDKAIDTGLDLLPDLSGPVQEFRVRWIHEGQDSPMVPTSGTRIVAEGFYGLRHPLTVRNYPGGELQLSHARPLQGRFSVLTGASGGVTQNQPGLRLRFPFGGPGQVSSLSPRELLGSRYYSGNAFLLTSLNSQSLSLFGKFYGAVGYELGRAWVPGIPATPRHSGTLGLLGETPFGLVFFGGAFGDQGDRKLFFRLGRAF
jgi:NTE family protein